MNDVLILSRIQFALTAGFHYLFPPLSIGLGLILLIMEGLYLKTKSTFYKRMTMFWMKIFSLSFALGVATGLVQLFSFGNNWSFYSRFVGDVFGSALAAEGIFAFFLEAGFIGVMLFGWNRVKPITHYIASICVVVGAHFSATWIVAANSWMQTPAGYKVIGTGRDARAVLTNFWEMIFNPSFVTRLTHVLIGCWLTGAFIVISISAYYFLKKRHLDFARISMKIGVCVALVMSVLQLISADSTARGVAQYQPAKLAAMEGIFKTEGHAPLRLFGWVKKEEEKVYGVSIPGLLNLLVHRNLETPVTGLDSFPKEDWPLVNPVFQCYHLMIYMWGAMSLAAFMGLVLWKKGMLGQQSKWIKWVYRYLIVSVAFPFIANEAGWFTCEMGRQPWIVYNILRTSEGAANFLNKGQLIGSLTMFTTIYLFLFALFLFILNRKIQHGPLIDDQDKEQVYSNPYLNKQA